MTATKKTKPHKTRRTYTFSLILGGCAVVSAEIEDALYEAGCDDALLGSRDGVLFLDFDRTSTSLLEAVLSAVADIHQAHAELWVSRVEPDDLVSAAEIARRAHRSRESIRQLIHGERGPGAFPPPIANLTQRSPIWRWSDVARWFADEIGGLDESVVSEATDLAAVNAALELKRTLTDVSAINRLWGSGAKNSREGLLFELKTRMPTAKRKTSRKPKRAARKKSV